MRSKVVSAFFIGLLLSTFAFAGAPNVYVSPEHHFKFVYPGKWREVKRQSGKIEILVTPATDNPDPNVVVLVPSVAADINVPLTAVEQGIVTGMKTQVPDAAIESAEDATLAGEPARHLVIKGHTKIGPAITTDMLLCQHGSMILTLSLQGTDAAVQQQLPVFEKIVTLFSFTDR